MMRVLLSSTIILEGKKIDPHFLKEKILTKLGFQEEYLEKLHKGFLLSLLNFYY